MLLQPPAQPQSPHQLGQSPPPHPFHSLPTSPRPSRHAHGRTSQLAGRRPPQYAHPLTRTHSFPLHGPSTGSGAPGAGHPEHTLRRKTPYGVLPAAYDSTVGDASLQPTKHILLPAAAAPPTAPRMAYPGTHRLPLRSFHAPPDAPYGSGHRTPYDASHETVDRPPMAHHLPQIDSMLHQLPTHHPPFPPRAGGQPFPGAVQQPLQSPVGPTVSNEQASFGPYGPNGAFVPFQPAETRDPRYLPPHPGSWLAPPPGALAPGAAGWYPAGLPTAMGPHGAFLHPPPTTPLATPLDVGHVFPGDPALARPFRAAEPSPHLYGLRHGVDPLHGPLLPGLAPSADPVHAAPGHRPSARSSGTSTPHGHGFPPVTPAVDRGTPTHDPERREALFTWAHGVYVAFLEHLHQTRKIALQHRQQQGIRQPIRPSIYPKPPRQPLFHLLGPADARPAPDRDAAPARHALGRASSLHAPPPPPFLHADPHRRLSWQAPATPPHAVRTLRRTSGTSIAPAAAAATPLPADLAPPTRARAALDALTAACRDGDWRWIEGSLLAGCFAYCLGDYEQASRYYSTIIGIDPHHVEAIANLAATCLAADRPHEAEEHWLRAIRLRPSYFDAVEHLIGLLCSRHRGQEAAQVIEFVERSLQLPRSSGDARSAPSSCSGRSPSASEASDRPAFDFDGDADPAPADARDLPGADQPGFGSSGYAVPGVENGRVVGLLHAKGNMLYSLGDNAGAARAFETAVLVAAGRRVPGVGHLIDLVLAAFADADGPAPSPAEPILLGPERAVHTARLCFPPHGDLPGLADLAPDPATRKAAVTTTSNSLLSLAKIFQDGMASNSPRAAAHQSTYGVREILALYYLSLALQPSPSTANNVGILLAGLQQAAPARGGGGGGGGGALTAHLEPPPIAGVAHGSGTHLALHYYNYGLNLDARHAHLYTNLGSLLKDIGQLSAAIRMYEQAVACDPRFDIALANLANAVKDQGRISDAIGYYKRAVDANPDFAEAVCGLANARNSVCDWAGRGGVAADRGARDRFHVTADGALVDARAAAAASADPAAARPAGWLPGVVDLVARQLVEGEDWGRGAFDGAFVAAMVQLCAVTDGGGPAADLVAKQARLGRTLAAWARGKWAGARLVRLVERAVRRLGWQWYQDRHVRGRARPPATYARPVLPAALTVPATPTVLPFHTFTSPLSARQIRLISQRNGLRISCTTLKAAWLPPVVFPPPPPPRPHLVVGYVSSDFNNHPLAHLMQSVFGLHDPRRVRAHCYATTPSDGSSHRQQIEREAPVFVDAHSWPAERLVARIVADGVHVLVNLNGYTRGARNEVFAARPAPVQMSFMGFAGTLGAEWCDYLLADATAVPPATLRPWRRNVDLEDLLVDDTHGGDRDDWVYGENVIFCRHSFFCCDHRQSAPDALGAQLSWEDEQARRWRMRRELFPQLPDDAIILANFNQLYKIEPTTFRTWLRILAQVPHAILWLLRFPELGESNLTRTALQWASPEVARRVVFTDVAPKQLHISRARVCDLFLDTPECNAHTTAADVLWSGTPLLTLPRYPYKMCARVAASVLRGALPLDTDAGRRAAADLIARDEADYEARAVRLARGCRYDGHRATGRLAELRQLLYECRWTSALFDTRRWTTDLEDAYEIAWARWVRGEGGDIWLDGTDRDGGRVTEVS